MTRTLNTPQTAPRTPLNWALVKQLILKDWYFHRPVVFGALALGALALGMIAVASEVWFAAGGIALITVVICLGAFLAIGTTVTERSAKTLPFVMSLPISMREYTTAKILGNLLIFLVPWSALLVAVAAIILIQPGLPDGLLSLALVALLELLVNFCLLLAVGLVSESQGWVSGGIVFGNLLLQALLSGFSSLPGVRDVIFSPVLAWNASFSAVLLLELGLLVGLVSLTFYLQSRKTDLL